MGILKPFTQWATSPWGQNVPIHIAWFLIWVAALSGLAFLIGHAIYLRYFAKVEEFEGDPPRTPAVALPQRIPRHSLTARSFHWIMAAAMFTLLFTAFLPRIGIQFDWVTYHWIAGTVLTASVIFHVIHASFWLDFWAIWPDKADLRDALRRVRRFMGLPAPPPRRFAKYPLENKLYHGGDHSVWPLRHRHWRVHDVSRAYDLLPAQSLSVQRHDLGPDVRSSRACRGRTHCAGDDARILCRASGETGDHQVDDLRVDETRVLSRALRPGALAFGIAAAGISPNRHAGQLKTRAL